MQLRALFLLALPLTLTACGDSADTEADLGDISTPIEEPVPQLDETSGTLVAGDVTLETGEFMDSYNILAREGQWIKAEVVSGDFDPHIMVISPTGVQTDVDDSALENTSMTKAILEASEGGEWTVIVTSFEPGESGSYELAYGALDEEPEDAAEGTQVVPDEDPTIET
ncbi:hypothetical protein [Rubrivirga sp.]|uniref:hypothetical protein n=1 Tax=Rubrivirga sp. TaxID=1885344 RepID=UPI003C788836